MTITWLTQGGFLFEHDNHRLVVDPYMSDSLKGKVTRLAPFPLSIESLRPDTVLCTHDHMDHLDPETIRMISEHYPRCTFAGPERAFQHLEKLSILRPKRLKLGIKEQFGPWQVTPVYARHSDPTAVGLVIERPNKKVYLTADTEYDERLFSPETADCHLLLICINGRLGNMTWQEATQAARKLKPLTSLPMHYGLFAENTENPDQFIAGCMEHGINSYEMEAGKEISI